MLQVFLFISICASGVNPALTKHSESPPAPANKSIKVYDFDFFINLIIVCFTKLAYLVHNLHICFNYLL